jgi:hypothetical protein
MPNELIPNVLAMLVCDQVIHEQGTNKRSLIGIFDNINAPAYPVQLRLAVYAKIADAEGPYVFLLRLVNLKDETLLSSIEMKANIASRSESAELAVNMIGIVFAEPGKYEFQLWADGTYLHRITLNAKLQGGQPWQPQSNQPQ